MVQDMTLGSRRMRWVMFLYFFILSEEKKKQIKVKLCVDLRTGVSVLYQTWASAKHEHSVRVHSVFIYSWEPDKASMKHAAV